jgi:hypothetical protein
MKKLTDIPDFFHLCAQKNQHLIIYVGREEKIRFEIV